MLWSPNLQLYYPLENSANDFSGNARHGTVTGATYATRPNAGRCLYFDGVGDYVSTPSFGLSGTVVVFACWVRCKLHATVPQTFISDNGISNTVGFIWIHRPANSNALLVAYCTGTGWAYLWVNLFFAGPYNDAWLHMAVARDYSGKKAYIFRQGILFATPDMTGTPVFPSTNRVKYIGVYAPANYYPLTDGYLDEGVLITLPTMPALAQVTANVNRLMLGMNPIW